MNRERTSRVPLNAFVGIDIASCIHVISALDFNQEFFSKMKPASNPQEGAKLLKSRIVDVLKANYQFKYVAIGMESTGFYGVHLAFYGILYIKTIELLKTDGI